MRFIEPARATSHFHLKAGDVVGDFGAGSGFFLPALSRAVGAEGTVYAFEIQKNLITRMERLVKEEQLQNVTMLWCDLEASEGCPLPEGTLDAIVMANALFQFEDKLAVLSEAARLLRSGGSIFLLDWSDSFEGLGPRATDVVPEEAAKELLLAHGFSFNRSFPVGEHHYGLVFRKT